MLLQIWMVINAVLMFTLFQMILMFAIGLGIGFLICAGMLDGSRSK